MNKHQEHPELPLFKPVVTFPTIAIPQADGSYVVRPGKPVVHDQPDECVSTRRAAQLLGLSLRRVETMCEEGILEWERVGTRGNYRIRMASIVALKTRHGAHGGE